MLVKISEPQFTVFFHIKDITRITPLFTGRKVDYYALELTSSTRSIKLSIQQLNRLIPFLSYVDLSINLDEPEELTAPLDEEFNNTISELLDMAIQSPATRPQHDSLRQRLQEAQTILKPWNTPP